jgi:muramidase (phage lysozyme)/DNA-binding phage protein
MAEVDNVRKFLDFLGRAEGADYNTVVGGSAFSDFSKHPNIVGLRTKEGPSTAAGKYQITKTTYDDFAPRVGVSDFSPGSQDKVALAIIQSQGALDDVKAGNFRAAIDKLGGRWASLPSSKYSQPKRSWEWSEKELQKPLGGSSPQLQFAATDPSGIAPTQSPGQSQLLISDLQKEEKYGGTWNTLTQVPTAIQYGFQNENNAYNWLTEQGSKQVDPQFVMTKDKLQAAAKDRPEEYKPYLAAALSDDDLARRVARLDEATKRQQEMANMGAGMSFFGSAAGSVLDVDSLLMFIPLAGEVAAANKVGRLGRAVRAGLAAGAINAGSEYAFGSARPTQESTDVYLAGLFGLGFGAAGGALAPVRKSGRDVDLTAKEFAAWAQKEANRVQKAEIEEAGMKLTPQGEDFFKKLDAQVEQARLEINASIDGMVADTRKSLGLDVEQVRKESVPLFERNDVANVNRAPELGGKERPAGSAKEVLTKIAERGTPEQSVIASRLIQQLPDDVNIYTVPKTQLSKGRNPYYDPNTHAIYIAKDTPETTKIHEIAHAITVHKIEYGLKNPESAIGQLTGELKGLFKQAKAQARKEGFNNYYLTNEFEFVAGLYGGSAKRQEFIDFLSKIKVEGDPSLLTQFVEAIRKILGMSDAETNAFVKSLNLADKLGDERLNVTLRNRTRGDAAKEGPLQMGSRSVRTDMADAVDPDFLPPKAADGSTPEGFWQGPAYENFFNRSWVPNEVKDFVRSIFGSTTGYKDHSVVAQAASDQKKALAGQWQNQFSKTLQPAINDFLERNPVPFGKKSEVTEKWNEQLSDYIRGIPGDYDPSIVKVGNEWRRLSKDVVDHINNPGKFSGDTKRGLTQREIVDPDTGEKRLSETLDYNETYLPRVPDTYKMSTAIAQFGRETVEKYIGNMFRSANNKISEELAGKLGKWYMRTIEDAKVNRASELVDNLLRGFDRVSFKDSLMKVGGLNPNDADRIIASMSKPAKGSDSGAFNGSLKRRSILDEGYTEKIILKDGSAAELSYKDLFDTDTVGLINQYFNKQAGAVSFANHTGIYSIQSAKQIIAELTERGFGSKITDEQLTKMRKHLVDIVDLHLGRPLEEFSTWNKSLQMVADYNILTKAGMFVLNQITEMSQLMGSTMHRSVLRTVPELNTLIRDTKTGKVSNEMIDAFENLSGGPGTQLLNFNPLSPNRTWVREKGDTSFNRWLDRADNVLRAGTNNLFKYTGMTGVTMLQQRAFAVAMVNHFVDHAVNGKKLGITPERLAWMGLGPEDAKAVIQGVRDYHKPGKDKLGEVDFNKWSQEDPKTFSKFIVAYQREAARVIQENDLSSMVPIMGKQIGKIMFQFMGFPLHAWNKSMLFAVNHKDMQTLHTVMWAIAFNTLMYTARTQGQMIGMSSEEAKDFADKRLSSSQIMLNAVGRIPQLSILPNMFDTVSPVPLFSGMRTTTDLTDFVSGNPTLSTISGALSMSKKVVRNAGSEDYQTTEKDMRAMFRLLPLNNMIGISNFLNSVSSEFPSRELVNE